MFEDCICGNCDALQLEAMQLDAVASLGGGADRPGWHPPGGWHPKKKNFVNKFTKNNGETRSDT